MTEPIAAVLLMAIWLVGKLRGSKSAETDDAKQVIRFRPFLDLVSIPPPDRRREIRVHRSPWTIHLPMSDPRNVAHDKKVIQEKKHHGEEAKKGAAETVQPGKKPEMKHPHDHEDPASRRAEIAAEEAEAIQESVAAHETKTDVHKTE